MSWSRQWSRQRARRLPSKPLISYGWSRWSRWSKHLHTLRVIHPRARSAYSYVIAWTTWTSLKSLTFPGWLPGPCLDHCLDQRRGFRSAHRARIVNSLLYSVAYVGVAL